MANRVVYYVNESFTTPEGYFHIVLVEENDPGYTPSKYMRADLASAHDLVNMLNHELGYSEQDKMDVVASSMAAQNRRDAEAAREIETEVTFDVHYLLVVGHDDFYLACAEHLASDHDVYDVTGVEYEVQSIGPRNTLVFRVTGRVVERS